VKLEIGDTAMDNHYPIGRQKIC